jgi:hypothetical protein
VAPEARPRLAATEMRHVPAPALDPRPRSVCNPSCLATARMMTSPRSADTAPWRAAGWTTTSTVTGGYRTTPNSACPRAARRWSGPSQTCQRDRPPHAEDGDSDGIHAYLYRESCFRVCPTTVRRPRVHPCGWTSPSRRNRDAGCCSARRWLSITGSTVVQTPSTGMGAGLMAQREPSTVSAVDPAAFSAHVGSVLVAGSTEPATGSAPRPRLDGMRALDRRHRPALAGHPPQRHGRG